MVLEDGIFSLVFRVSMPSTVCRLCNAMLLKLTNRMVDWFMLIIMFISNQQILQQTHSVSAISDIGPWSCLKTTMAVFITASFVQTVTNSSASVIHINFCSFIVGSVFGTSWQQILSRRVVIGTHWPHSHLLNIYNH